MKALWVIPFVLLSACSQPDDAITREWLSKRDGRESIALYTGISNVVPTTTESVNEAFRAFAAIEMGTKQLARPIEQKQTPTWTTYVIRAEKNNTEGFVILSRWDHRTRIWTGRFIPQDWFNRNTEK